MGDGSVANSLPCADVKTHEPGWAELVRPRKDDSLMQFLDAGISLRRLLWHGLVNLDWLAKQSDAKLRICYRNEDGAVIEEKVSRFGLIKRAEQLGWSPWPADPGTDESEVLCFLEAIPYSDGRGRTWWATEFCEVSFAPLCLPEKKLQALRDKARRNSATLLKKLDREKAVQAKKRRRELREQHLGYIRTAATKAVLRSIEAGKPISFESAMRNERRFLADLTKSVQEGLKKHENNRTANERERAE